METIKILGPYIASIVTGFISFLIARSKSKEEIKKIESSHKHKMTELKEEIELRHEKEMEKLLMEHENDFQKGVKEKLLMSVFGNSEKLNVEEFSNNLNSLLDMVKAANDFKNKFDNQ